MLDKLIKMGLLYDYYGNLLTEKQREIWKLYYHHDLSLSEIAERYEVSRQAVYDLLQRTEKALDDFEEKLNLIKKTRTVNSLLEELEQNLEKEKVSLAGNEEIRKIIRKIKELL